MISSSSRDETINECGLKSGHDDGAWEDTVVDSEDSGCVFNSTESVPSLNKPITAGPLKTTRVDTTAKEFPGEGRISRTIDGSTRTEGVMKETLRINDRGAGEMDKDVANFPHSQSHSSIVHKMLSGIGRASSHPSLSLNPAKCGDPGRGSAETAKKDVLPNVVRCHSATANVRRAHTGLPQSCSLPVLVSSNLAITELKKERRPGLPPLDLITAESSSDLLRREKPHSSNSVRDSNSLNIENHSKYLPTLKTEDARRRNYLIGNLNSKGALLGAEELERYFPNRKLTLFVATWNVHGKITSESLADFLLPRQLEDVPDMYVIGAQEAHFNRHEWEVKLQETIGLSHVLFNSVFFGALHLAVFLRRELIWFCSVAEESSFKLNASINTKGVVATQFLLFGTSFLFLCSHFTAHDDKVSERIEDYRRVLSNLDLPHDNLLRSRKDKKDLLEKHDCVFWFGDFNFRLNQNRDTVLRQIERIREQIDPNFEDLLRDDQLRHCMSAGDAFKGFNEGRINFMPTYKYNSGSNLFDSSEKQRVPSYTDRILYRNRKKNTISCVFYDSAQELCSSDHKPVFGLFEIILRPGRDNVPLAAGSFKREIYLQAVKKRAKGTEFTTKSQIRMASNSTICDIT